MASRKSNRRSFRARIEGLEDRRLLTAGALDATFGNGGLATSAAFNGQVANASGNGANAVAVYPTTGTVNDGKIVVAGQAYGSSGADFGVARFNTDGTPDSSFGKGGSVITAVGKYADAPDAVAVQPDGKIVAVGYAQVGSSSDNAFALVRYNSDGSLDTGFGTKGIVTSNPTRYNDTLHAVALQPDGKIVVAGSTYNQGVSTFDVARYNSNGSLDKTFGGTGIVTTSANGTADAVAIYPSAGTANDGKIVIAGVSTSGAFAVLRFNPNGSLDTSFNGTGEATTALGAGGGTGSNAEGVVIQPDGNIVAAGETDDGSPSAGGTANDISLVRYLGTATTINAVTYPAGSLDPNFGTGGIVIKDYNAGSNDYAHSVALQADGKILIAGSTAHVGSTIDFLLGRFNTDGSLDTTYGPTGTGWVATDFAGGSDYATGIALQSDGKAVAAGFSMLANTQTYTIGLARYLGDSTTTPASILVPSPAGAQQTSPAGIPRSTPTLTVLTCVSDEDVSVVAAELFSAIAKRRGVRPAQRSHG